MNDTGANKWEKIAMIVVAFLVGLCVIQYLDIRQQMKRNMVRVGLSKLQVAVKAHAKEYGFYPQGDAAAISAALRGGNARRIMFFETDRQFINGKGEVVDAWGAPFRFDLDNAVEPRIWSTGRNRRDDQGADGSDDIRSWK